MRHDRHTVSLLTDPMVFAPKYRGKIEIIEIAVNPDHVHIFFKEKNSRILWNGAVSICGHRVASMGLWGRDGKWWKNISRLKIHTCKKRWLQASSLSTGLEVIVVTYIPKLYPRWH